MLNNVIECVTNYVDIFAVYKLDQSISTNSLYLDMKSAFLNLKDLTLKSHVTWLGIGPLMQKLILY